MDDLLECLLSSELRSSKRTSLYVLESECLLLLVLRFLDEFCHNLGNKVCKPYKNESVDQIEECMEHRETVKHSSTSGSVRTVYSESFGSRVRVAHEFDDFADKAEEWPEEYQSPYDSEYVEYGMR